MTATIDETTELTEHLADARSARLQRLRAFRKQMDRADQDADTGSLDRATDIAQEFAEKEWVKELPEVTKSHYRGQPIKADGLSRFAGWAKANIGYEPRHVYQLIRADEVHGILCAAAQSIPEGTGERALRPLSKLLKDKRVDEIPKVWSRALDTGALPTHKQVGNALRAHDKALGRTPATRAQAYEARTVREAHKRLLRDFDYIAVHGTAAQVKAVLADLEPRVVDLEQTRGIT